MPYPDDQASPALLNQRALADLQQIAVQKHALRGVYDSSNKLVGITDQADAMRNFTQLVGNTLGVIGDSRDDRAFGGTLTGTTPGTWAQSYSTLKWALSRSGQPFRRVADFSKSASGMGITASTASVHPTFPEQMASVLAARPAYCWIRVPTNDIQNGATAAQVWAVFKQLVDTVLDAGIRVELIACTLLDSTKGGYSAFTQTEIVKLNDLVRAQYGSAGALGVVFHDTAAAAMQQNVAACAGVTGAYADITHFQNIGAYLESEIIAQSWLQRFKPLPILGRYAGDAYRDVPANNSAVGTKLNVGSSNYLPNGMFDLGTPVSGLAQGWNVAFATNCTYVASIVAAPLWDGNTDGKGQQFAVTATAANAVMQISSANMFTDLVLMKRYIAAALISIQAGATNLKNVRMELVAADGTITFNDTHGLTVAGDDAIPTMNANGCTEVALCDLDLSLRPDLVKGGSNPSFRVNFYITFGSAASGTATVIFSRGANRQIN